MEINFINPGVEYMIQSIMEFQTEEMSAFWSEPLYHFYPRLDRDFSMNLPFPERSAYLERILRDEYFELENIINQKVALYSSHWTNCKGQIEAALSDAFEIDCTKLFNDLQCNICMNPVSPRFLKKRCFEVFYLNSEKGAIGTAIHEIIHFVWFYIWNSLFHDTCKEYEKPSLKWILSEMVVESVMSDKRLSSINPYYPRENGGCIYPYFFDMTVDGKLILDTLDAMYRSQNIKDFMRNSYAYCQKYELKIRKHIQQSEK